ASGDFNGDGLVDVIYRSSDNKWTAHLAPLPGSSAQQVSLPGLLLPYNVRVVDLNADGLADLVVYQILNNDIVNDLRTYINTTPPGGSTVTFALGQVLTPGSPPYLQDIDGDGFVDLFQAVDPLLTSTGVPNVRYVWSYRLNTAGTFGEHQEIATRDDMPAGSKFIWMRPGVTVDMSAVTNQL